MASGHLQDYKQPCYVTRKIKGRESQKWFIFIEESLRSVSNSDNIVRMQKDAGQAQMLTDDRQLSADK